jgi:hypothetical protein
VGVRDKGRGLRDEGFELRGSGFRGFKASCVALQVWDLELRVHGSGLEVFRVGFRVQGSVFGFEVSGFGFWRGDPSGLRVWGVRGLWFVHCGFWFLVSTSCFLNFGF